MKGFSRGWRSVFGVIVKVNWVFRLVIALARSWEVVILCLIFIGRGFRSC